MGLVEQAKIDASQISFTTKFNSALMAVADPAREIAMELPSSTKTEDHDWLGTVPGFEELLDDVKLSNLRAENIRIVNKRWANGIRIDIDDILDDRLQIIGAKLSMLARKGAIHYGQLIIDALITGFVTTGVFGASYDGQAFFSATHQDGSGPVQSNTNGTALTNANYFAARTLMWSLTDEVGDELGIVPDTLLVGPSLEETARQITGSELVPSAAGTASQSNVARGTARVIISPRLIGAAASHWFLLSLNQEVKPIILQIREAINSMQTRLDDDNGFMRNELKFKATARHNVGYGLWQHAFGSNA